MREEEKNIGGFSRWRFDEIVRMQNDGKLVLKGNLVTAMSICVIKINKIRHPGVKISYVE